jgi:hypothetical protein
MLLIKRRRTSVNKYNSAPEVHTCTEQNSTEHGPISTQSCRSLHYGIECKDRQLWVEIEHGPESGG